MKTKGICCFCVLIIFFVCPQLLAEVKLAGIFGSNMVLQQQSHVKIWGIAEPGEKISIHVDWKADSNSLPANQTVADKSGKWLLRVRTPEAGGPYQIRIKGNNELFINNVLIGEVWLCSGQSNMEMPMQGFDKLQQVQGSDEEIANSHNKSIRIFIISRNASEKPLKDISGQWAICTPESVKHFSAVGYYFGKEINKKTGYPTGLIMCAYGGSLAQAWTRIEYLQNDDELHSVIDVYARIYNSWLNDCNQAEKNHTEKPAVPWKARDMDRPAALYNAMIAPILPFQIRGVIWYQGESNADSTYQYRKLFPVMINNWRCDFEQFDMPFYFVQLASFVDHNPGQKVEIYKGEPRDNVWWANLREAQLMTCGLKNTAMAVTIDLGEANNIHPANKKDVGHRLALCALANTYGHKIEYSGPLYSGYQVEGQKIKVFFNHAAPCLIAKGETPTGFAIAGKDKKFVWANAIIEGIAIVVSSPLVAEPAAVRYAWDTFPNGNIYNMAGLPASPFRTDGWNGHTNAAQ